MRRLLVSFVLPLVSLVPGPPEMPVLVAAAGPLASSSTSATSGTLAWPLRGPILRGYEQPSNPYASGHRGIDIGAPVASPVRAAEAGVVRFAGKVAGSLFVSLDHDGGIQTTYSWVSRVDVKKGDHVERGTQIALSGDGHPGSTEPSHLHFGVKEDGEYVDPLTYLGAVDIVDLIHLAPLPSEG